MYDFNENVGDFVCKYEKEKVDSVTAKLGRALATDTFTAQRLLNEICIELFGVSPFKD